MELAYKPTTNTFRCTTEQLQVVLQGDAFQHKLVIGVVTFSTTADSDVFDKIIPISKSETNYFHALNNALHELDLAGLNLILIEQPPESEEWRAVNERLRQTIQPLVEVDNGKWTVFDTVIAADIAFDLLID